MSVTDATKHALVIGAHPDDNEFGAGGTIAKLAQQGWEITFIIATNGNKGSHDAGMSSYRLSELREHEQRAAANVLGVKRVIFLRNNDGAFGWQSAPAEAWARVRHELAQKQGANQGLGLALFWQNGPFGGTFHLDPPHADSLTLWIVWYPERMRLLDAGGLTDHSWYLRRVVPPLVAAGIVVRSLSCSDG
jgi:hypothetical protein